MSYYQNQNPGQQQHYPPPPPQQGYQQPQQQYQQQQQQQPQYQHQVPSPPPQQHQQYHQQATSPPPQQLQPPASPAPPGQGQAQYTNTENGQFEGGSYTITHRHTNSILTARLQAPGAAIKAKTGAMIHMSPTIALEGKIKFSMKKMLTGGSLSESVYTGNGLVSLAPTLFGDITTIRIDGSRQWNIGKDAFLACTTNVSKETKAQGLGKALFSGEDLFVYRVVGQGLLWASSFGAIDRIDLQQGEQHIVDNGHLVAWSCNYAIERVGGAMNSLKSGEGLVCRFTGPGSVLVQTRNLNDFAAWVAAAAGGTQ